MSQETRTDLKALIDLYITTNGNKDVTGAQLNEILTNIIDSGFLQLDELRTALSTTYDPATPANWNATIPTEVKAALDQAISRVVTLEAATVSPTSISFNVNSDSTVSLPYVENELINIDTSSEARSQTLSAAYYQVSLNGTTWQDPNGTGNSTLLELSNYISTITSGNTYSIRAIGVYNPTATGEASIKFNFTY